MLTSVAMAGQAETPRAEHSFVNSKGFPTLITDSATEGLHVLSLGQKKCRLRRAVRVASTATDSSVMCLHMLTEMCLDLHVTLHEGLQVGIKQMLQIVHIDGPQVRANRRGLDKRYSYCRKDTKLKAFLTEVQALFTICELARGCRQPPTH